MHTVPWWALASSRQAEGSITVEVLFCGRRSNAVSFVEVSSSHGVLVVTYRFGCLPWPLCALSLCSCYWEIVDFHLRFPPQKLHALLCFARGSSTTGHPTLQCSLHLVYKEEGHSHPFFPEA